MLPTGDTALAAPQGSPVTRARGGADSPRFYVGMAYACAAVAIVGFIPTYWAPVMTGAFAGSLPLHVHGLLFSAWPLLFMAQARYAAAGRIDHHRALGVAGVVLAASMLVAGLLVAITAIDHGIARGFERQVRAASIVPVTIILFFATTVAVAIGSIRRPAVHKRLMLVASVSLLPPAVARMLFALLAPAGSPMPGSGEPPPVVFSLAPALAADLLLLVAVVHDWRRRGRPHTAFVVAGLLLLTLQIVRIPLSGTALWWTVTNWLLAISP